MRADRRPGEMRMPDAARVMVVTAHPDDMEILCGGTLARFAARGDEVTVCHACNGNMGHVEIPPDELVGIRWEEAERAAAIIGARHVTLGLPDLGLVEAEEPIAELASIMREVRPTVLITHDPDDYMPDHSDLAHLVLKASFVATLPQYAGLRGDVYPLVPPVYFLDTIMGVGFQPEDYVDITDHFDTKRRMLECHASQVDWLRDHDRIDVLEHMRIWAQFRGLQSGVRYAEAFRRHRVWPRMTPERLLP